MEAEVVGADVAAAKVVVDLAAVVVEKVGAAEAVMVVSIAPFMAKRGLPKIFSLMALVVCAANKATSARHQIIPTVALARCETVIGIAQNAETTSSHATPNAGNVALRSQTMVVAAHIDETRLSFHR